jgi:hypothetical protein
MASFMNIATWFKSVAGHANRDFLAERWSDKTQCLPWLHKTSQRGDADPAFAAHAKANVKCLDCPASVASPWQSR